MITYPVSPPKEESWSGGEMGLVRGEFVITPALMMGMDETILDRIAFGGVKELEELYLQ
jgi:hypothetical protein